MFLALVGVGVDFNEGEVIVVAEWNPVEGVEGVAIVSTAMVKTEVVLLVGIALRDDSSHNDDAPASLRNRSPSEF